MQDSRPCRRPPRRPLSPPEPEALEHLEVIRQTMERSATFTAVSGWGYVGMGATALVAFFVGLRQATTEAWIAVWLAEALVAVTIGLVAMHWKASRLGTPILSIPGRRLFVGLLPALVAGGILTVALLPGRRSPPDPRRLAAAVWRGSDAGGRVFSANNSGDGRGVRSRWGDRTTDAMVLGKCHARRRVRSCASVLRRIYRKPIRRMRYGG